MSANTNNQSIESTCSAGGFNFLWTAFSLVPVRLYDEETPDLWINFLRDRIPTDQKIRRVALPSQDCVCLIEEKRNAENLEHVVPYLIREAERLAVNIADGTIVTAIRLNDRLAVAVLKNGKLQMANIFESSTKEQTLYWLLSAYEQIKLPHTTPLYIRCGTSTRKLMDAHLEVFDL